MLGMAVAQTLPRNKKTTRMTRMTDTTRVNSTSLHRGADHHHPLLGDVQMNRRRDRSLQQRHKSFDALGHVDDVGLRLAVELHDARRASR